MKRKKRRAIHGNIKRLREAHGWTQDELGRKCGASDSLVSHWERGKCAPHSELLPVVAAVLETTVDDLLAEPSS